MLQKTLSAMVVIVLACAPDREPLEAQGFEELQQDLGASAKRLIVTPPPGCDEACVRGAISDAGGDHGPGIFGSAKVVALLREDAAGTLASRGFGLEEDLLMFVNGKTTSSPPAQTTPWGITRVGASSAWLTTAGAGVKVVIIDTGRPSHPDVNANPLCANFTNESSCADNNGHSTHVGGTVAALDNATYVVGVAHQADVYFCKALNRRGSGYISWITSCINWASSIGAQVINMSLGASSGTASLEAACNDADASGTLVVAAAGNEGPGQISYPAAYDSVVSVAATDSSDVVAYFSNTNSDVEWAAPGVSILSTCKGGGLCTYSGTSMASPHAAATAALVKAANPALSNACVRSLISSTATDLGAAGPDTAYGNGLVNAAAAIAAAPTYVCP